MLLTMVGLKDDIYVHQMVTSSEMFRYLINSDPNYGDLSVSEKDIISESLTARLEMLSLIVCVVRDSHIKLISYSILDLLLAIFDFSETYTNNLTRKCNCIKARIKNKV